MFTRYFQRLAKGKRGSRSLLRFIHRTHQKDSRFSIGRCLVIILLILFSLTSYTPQAAAKDGFWGVLSKTVVLDPGHGGHDTGAKGPGGMPEKTVVLHLALKIAAFLKDHCRVILTRTDDYWIDIPERTAAANQAGADLFVSLHTGAGFLHRQAGTFVYFFREASEPPTSSKSPAAPPLNESDSAVVWDAIQFRHTKQSQELARLIHQYLVHPDASKPGGVLGAPLLVLRGADMPAVLVEPGYLTHPVEGKMLTDPKTMDLFAEKIGNAIIVFLKKLE